MENTTGQNKAGRMPRLTSSSLIHTIKAKTLAFLRQTNQCQQDMELVPVQSDLFTAATTRRNDVHDACLGISAESGSGQRSCHPGRRDAASTAVLGNDLVERLNVALGHVGRRQ
jgi:hypothetical protein